MTEQSKDSNELIDPAKNEPEKKQRPSLEEIRKSRNTFGGQGSFGGGKVGGGNSRGKGGGLSRPGGSARGR